MANIITFTLNPAFSGTDADNFDIVGVHENGSPADTTIATNVLKADLATGVTYTIAETITGGTICATNEVCAETCVVWTLTGGPTPTPTITSSNNLNVYAKFINATQELQYSINMNTPISLGVIDSLSCNFVDTITGLSNGDSIQFTTVNACAIGGDNTTCPGTTPGTAYTYTFGSGNENIYLTVNGGNCA